MNGYLDVVEEMIIVGVDVNLKYGNFILFIVVCCNGWKYLVVKLIKVGVDVNVNKGDYLFI